LQCFKYFAVHCFVCGIMLWSGTDRCAASVSLPLFICLYRTVITCYVHFYENCYWRVMHTLSTHCTFGQSHDSCDYVTGKETYICMPCECTLSSYAHWRESCCCILRGPGGERIVDVVHINMCLILDSYRVMTAWNLE